MTDKLPTPGPLDIEALKRMSFDQLRHYATTQVALAEVPPTLPEGAATIRRSPGNLTTRWPCITRLLGTEQQLQVANR